MAALNKNYRAEFSDNLSQFIEQQPLSIINSWPINAVTNLEYDSATQLYLALIAVQHGYDDFRWCTKEQCTSNGWKIKDSAVLQKIESFNAYNLREKRNLSYNELQAYLKEPQKRSDIKFNGGTYQVINARDIDGIAPLKEIERDVRKIALEIEAVAKDNNIDFTLADKTKLSEIGQLHRNAGYYILTETNSKALGFSPTAPSSIVIWDRTSDGYYANGHYGNTLSLLDISDLRFQGMDIDGALSKLESIGFDWRDTIKIETELENSVLNFAKQKMMELDIQDVKIIGVKEYDGGGEFGTNVLLEYTGNIREDDFFSILHENDFTVDGNKIDISPITASKSGTIEQYIESLGKEPEINTKQQEQSDFLQKITAKNLHGGMYGEYHVIDSNHNYGLGFNPFAEEGKKFVLMDSTYTPRLASENKEIDFLSIPENDSSRYFDFKTLSDWNSFCLSHGFSSDYLNKFFEEIEYTDYLNGNEKSPIFQKVAGQLNKPVVYVCSPLAGEIEANIRKAREYSKFVAKEGNTPIAPHITELFNDTIPEERELGLSLGIDYLHKADELWVFGDRISNGMAAEIKLAQDELHIPIFHIDDKTLVKVPFNEYTLPKEILSQTAMSAMQPLLDEIAEYEADFDIPTFRFEEKSPNEIAEHLSDIKSRVQNNALKSYDEPFIPSQDKSAYPVNIHNPYSNTFKTIGYSNDRAYTFSADEYKAFEKLSESIFGKNKILLSKEGASNSASLADKLLSGKQRANMINNNKSEKQINNKPLEQE